MHSQCEKYKELKEELIPKFWKRARVNALAHRIVMNRTHLFDSLCYLGTIITSLLSIFCIILAYIAIDINSSNPPPAIMKILQAVFQISALDYTLCSIIFAFISLTITIFNNHMQYGIVSEQHKFTHNSYVHLALMAREAKHPDIDENKLIALYDLLEKTFVTVKVRGIEPQDKHFDEAHILFKKIEGGEVSSNIQSFNIKNDDRSKTDTDKNIKNKNWSSLLQSIKSKWFQFLSKFP